MPTYALIGISTGVVRTRDYRMAPEGRWSRELVLCCGITFEEYVVPSTVDPEVIVIDGAGMPLDPPFPAEGLTETSLILGRLHHSWLHGCGCVALQRGLGAARNHNELCRARMELEIEKTLDVRERKQ